MSVANWDYCTEFRELDIGDTVFSLERVCRCKNWSSRVAAMDGHFVRVDSTVIRDVLQLTRPERDEPLCLRLGSNGSEYLHRHCFRGIPHM